MGRCEGDDPDALARLGSGGTVCQLPRGSEYFVTLRCASPRRPVTSPSSRTHILALAFHDEGSAEPARPPGERPPPGARPAPADPRCFHLFVSVQVTVVAGVHDAPALQQLRASAPPFFPEALHRLFDTRPQYFLVARVAGEDASFLAFSRRNHAPACEWVSAMARSGFPPQPGEELAGRGVAAREEEACEDGFPPALTPKHTAQLLRALDAEEEAMRAGIAHFDMFHATMKAVTSLSGAERMRLGIRHPGGPGGPCGPAGDPSHLLLYQLQVGRLVEVLHQLPFVNVLLQK